MITKGRKPTKVTSGEPKAKTKELEIQPRLGSLVHFSRLTTHDASKKPTGSEEFGVEAFQALFLSLSLSLSLSVDTGWVSKLGMKAFKCSPYA